MIVTIDKYFGHMKPNMNLPKLNLAKEEALTAPVVKEILGPDAENITLAWRFPDCQQGIRNVTDCFSDIIQ